MTRFNIRLPSSGGRSGSFLKLLSRVDPEAENGFGFEGRVLPGRLATLATLRPGGDFPETPIILEYAQAEPRGIPGNTRRDALYILWRLDVATLEWGELGRAVSAAWEWAVDLRPLALRALAESRGEARAAAPASFDLIAARISEFIDKELAALMPGHRSQVLAVLHDDLAKRSSSNPCMIGHRAA